MTDYDAILFAPIYSTFGVAAALTPNRADPPTVSVTAIDRTAGVEVSEGIDLQTLRPAALVMARSLVAAGIATAELDGGTIVLNGRTWRIDLHHAKPSPNGESAGEIMMFLVEPGA